MTVQGQPNCSSAACRWINVTLNNFAAGTYSGTCWSTVTGPFWTFTIAAGQAKAPCYFGYPGQQAWVVVDGIASNHITW